MLPQSRVHRGEHAIWKMYAASLEDDFSFYYMSSYKGILGIPYGLYLKVRS